MHGRKAPRKLAAYRLRREAWDRIVEELEWTSKLAAARSMGVSHTQIGRVLTGETSPGERFMASLMSQLPPYWRHEDVFELVEDGDRG